MKSYSKITEILASKKRDSKECKKIFLNSDVFKIINSKFPKITEDKVVFSNITSLSMQKDPDKIRIRNDKFLGWVKNDDFDCLLVSIAEHYGQNYYYLFLGKSFKGYYKRDNASNSFLTFDFNELFPEGGWGNNFGLKIKNIYKKNCLTTKFFYYVSESALKTIKDNEELKSFCNIVNSSSLSPYIEPKSTNNRYISASTREKIMKTYPKRCVCSIGGNICYSYSVDWDKFEKNPEENKIHLHHFIWKSFFESTHKSNDLDWEIINHYLNLVPLCSSCHSAIHNGEPEIKLKILNKIFEVQKKLWIHDEFIKYFDENKKYIKIKFEDIVNHYNEVFPKLKKSKK